MAKCTTCGGRKVVNKTTWDYRSELPQGRLHLEPCPDCGDGLVTMAEKCKTCGGKGSFVDPTRLPGHMNQPCTDCGEGLVARMKERCKQRDNPDHDHYPVFSDDDVDLLLAELDRRNERIAALNTSLMDAQAQPAYDLGFANGTKAADKRIRELINEHTGYLDEGGYENRQEIKKLKANNTHLTAQLAAIEEEGTAELNAAVDLRRKLVKERADNERLRAAVERVDKFPLEGAERCSAKELLAVLVTLKNTARRALGGDDADS